MIGGHGRRWTHTLKVSILDRMFDFVGGPERPWASRTTYLHLACSKEASLFQFDGTEFRRREEEGHLPRVVLKKRRVRVREEEEGEEK
jgi:hypothetical protein